MEQQIDLWDHAVELLEDIIPIKQIYTTLTSIKIPDSNPNNEIDINTIQGIRTYGAIKLLSFYSNDIEDRFKGLITKLKAGLNDDTATIEKILELSTMANSIAGYEVLNVKDQEEDYKRYKKQIEQEALIEV